MRLGSFAATALLATLLPQAWAAPTWQTVSSEPGKRIELDRTSIKRDETSRVQATGRITLDKELTDAKSGLNYRIIEATTSYDCATRNANTVKRIFRKNDSEVIREEEIKGADMPVRSGTLDDKVLREVCRPGKSDAKADQKEVAHKVNEAASKLKEANAEVLKKDAAKTESHPVKVSDPHGEPAAAKHAVAHVKAPAVKAERLSSKKAKDSHVSHEEATHQHVHWAYEGEGAPENWAGLDPANAVCASGQRQSPIDIRDGIPVDLETLRFNYQPAPFKVVDNGHTIQVNVRPGTLTVMGKAYELLQFHFHRPSEERVNGRAYEMVAHLVHKSADGQLAVVAVLFDRGPENQVIQNIWNNLPLAQNVEVAPPNALMDVKALLPDTRSYFTYMGSLTTPPCTEGVLWIVLRQPALLSSEQIRIFSRLYPNNARPIQPAANRVIKESR